MEKDLVSVIILNWNNRDTIEQCLQSVLEQAYPHREIIVVDNGSTDGSLEAMRSKFNDAIRFLENPVNVGFAKGVNIGIRASQGQYIALLNSDAVADPQWLSQLVSGLQQAPDYQMAGGKTFLENRGNLLDNTGLVMSPDGQNRCRGRLEEDQGQYDQIEEILAPSGCAAIYSRKMLKHTGLFDENFFAYGEDLELALRARLMGYRSLYVPNALVTHRLSGSSDAHAPLKVYYVERNRQWILIKCFPLQYLLEACFYSLQRYCFLIIGIITRKGPSHQYRTKSGGFSLAWILIKTYLSTLWNLPVLMKSRNETLKKATHKQEFKTWLKLYSISVRDAALKEII